MKTRCIQRNPVFVTLVLNIKAKKHAYHEIGVGCTLADIQAEERERRIHATTDVILCCTIERQSSKTLANSWCFPSLGARQRSACMEGQGGGRKTQRRSSGLLKRRWVRRRTGSCVHNGKGDVRRCSIPAGPGGTGSRVHVGKERRHERCSTSRQAADMHLPSWCSLSLRTRTLQCSARNDRNMSSMLRTLQRSNSDDNFSPRDKPLECRLRPRKWSLKPCRRFCRRYR